MRVDKNTSAAVLATALVFLGAYETHLVAQQSVRNEQWSVQVDNVEPGDVNLDPAFRVAIYKNLLDELAKTHHFKQVVRGGDRNAAGLSALVILKTAVENYTPGSETRRAVTTVSGGDKVESPKSALLTAGSSDLGTHSGRQCPFFRI